LGDQLLCGAPRATGTARENTARGDGDHAPRSQLDEVTTVHWIKLAGGPGMLKRCLAASDVSCIIDTYTSGQICQPSALHRYGALRISEVD
jgi:hypothetical protein